MNNRNNLITSFLLTLIVGMAVLVSPGLSKAQVADRQPDQLEKLQVKEHLGDTIPMDLTFTNSKGEQVKLQDYFKEGRPVLLTLNYYECPMLCTFILNGVSKAAGELKWTPGDEYQIVTVSIDPTETPALAAAKHENYIKSVGKQGAGPGWAFLVGEEENIRTLSDAVGFPFYWDEEGKQYNHPAVSFVLSDHGKISRYLYGLDRNSNNLRLALLEASEGEIGNAIDKVVLYCSHYDPDAGGYVVIAARVMNIGGILTVIILATVLGIYWYRERHRTAEDAQTD